jgi:hypothetical protein
MSANFPTSPFALERCASCIDAGSTEVEPPANGTAGRVLQLQCRGLRELLANAIESLAMTRLVQSQPRLVTKDDGLVLPTNRAVNALASGRCQPADGVAESVIRAWD